MRRARRSSAGFAGATIPGGRFRKGGEAPLRVKVPDDVKLIPQYYRLSRERRGPTAILVGLATS